MNNIFNTDFRDFLQALNNNGVGYLLVGGYAVILHGHSRTTGDMDIWVKRTKENYQKIVMAFEEFKMPLFDMTENNFLYHITWDVFRFGRKPVAIDIMVQLKGFDFDECYANAKEFIDDNLLIKVIHIDQLIEAKRNAGRGKDIEDIKHLQ